MKSAKVLSLVVLSVVLVVLAAWHLGPAIAREAAYGQAKGESDAARQQLEGFGQAEQLSTLFRNVSKAVQPSVVEIRTTKMIERTYTTPFGDFFDSMPPEMRRQYGQSRGRKRQFQARGLGSGVIIDSKEGYILTNNHVVAEADKVVVVLQDGREIETDWVRRDPDTDLAVVKIEADNLIASPLGDSDKMQVGDWVLAVGSPMGYSHTVTAGIVSAKGRSSSVRGGATFASYIQTDAAINQGNSGGPLVNMRGEVIGINTAIITPSGAFAGIGLSIPSKMAGSVMDQLINKGKVSRGFLGVTLEENEDGVMIQMVVDGTAAAKADIRVGDKIVAIDGKRVEGIRQAMTQIAAMQPGTTHKFDVLRDGDEVTLDVVMGERPDDISSVFNLETPGQPKTMDLHNYGIEVAELDEELAKRYGYDEAGGVVITAAAPQMQARGVREGLKITQINYEDIANIADLRKAIDASDDDVLTVRLKSATGGMTLRLAPIDGDGSGYDDD